ncbi:MAG: glycosyltransferase family protein [Aeromicrobium sp.]
MPGHEPRLLIYSQDGLGLGHMRRTSLLAGEFLRTLPGSSALTISDSPLGRFFPTAPGHDYLKLPSIRKSGPGVWESVTLSSTFHDVLAMRSSIIATAVEAFDPHVLLVDHMPHGAMGELLPALRKIRRNPVKIILGLRDILDAPEVIKRTWVNEGAIAAVDEFYDEVIIYGSRDVLDVATEYEWPMPVAERLSYSGYVCAPTSQNRRPLPSRHTKRAEGDKLVLAMAGGGADAYPMFSSVLSAASHRSLRSGVRFLMVTGPFMPTADRLHLQSMARGLPVTLVKTVDESPAYMSAADLVIAMAGYNTTVELLKTGTPALLVPRNGPSAEQRTRAKLFAGRGWVNWLDPHELDQDRMAGAIVASLDAPNASLSGRPGPDLRGRQASVQRILDMLGERSPFAELQAVPT